MTPRCCVCLETGVAELVPVSCRIETHQKTVLEMIHGVVSTHIGTVATRQPVDVKSTLCDTCLGRLDQAYSTWMRCKEAILSLKLKKIRNSCCVCYTGDATKLVSANSICSPWDITISSIFGYVTAVELQGDVEFDRYVCRVCLDDLDEAYEFKTRLLKSESDAITCLLNPWEKMDFEENEPTRLVVEVHTKMLRKPGGEAFCSVCGLECEISQLAANCGGCCLKIKSFEPKTEPMEDDELDEYECAAEDVFYEYQPEDIEVKYEEQADYSSDESESEPVKRRKRGENKQKALVPKKRIYKREEIDQLFDVMKTPLEGPFLEVHRKGPVCCGCSEFFLAEAEYKAHLKREHPKQEIEETPHVCRICNNSFESAFGLEMHKRRTPRKIFYYCTECKILLLGRSIYRMHNVQKHMSQQNQTEAKGKYAAVKEVRYKCCVNGCNLVRSTRELMDKHLAAVHEAGPEAQNTCQYCGLGFRYRADYETHVERRQDRQKYACRIDDCTYETIHKRTMVWHCSAKEHVKPIRIGKKSAQRANLSAPDLKHFVVSGTIGERLDVLDCIGAACCNCWRFFDSQEELRKHVEDDHAVKDSHTHRCQVCNKGFSKHVVMVRHINKLKDQRYYYCRPCKVFLWDSALVDNHNAVVHAKVDLVADDRFERITVDYFTCCGCGARFGTEEELTAHRKEDHPLVKTIPGLFKSKTCDHCHKTFKTVKKLEDHIGNFEDKIVYKCKEERCYFETTSLTSIAKHVSGKSHVDEAGNRVLLKALVDVQPEQVVKPACCVCGMEFASEEEVVEHAKSEHENKRVLMTPRFEDSPYICPVCCRGFTIEEKLLKHRSNRKRKCRNCTKSFDLLEFQKHDEQCSKVSEIVCDLCGLKFKNKYSLTKHKHSMHQPKQEIQICPVCGKHLRPTSIQYHMESHENKRTWQCKLCPASFNNKVILDRHQRVHTAEKTFPCRHGCSNKYRSSGDRVRHENQKHLGILPFACQICGDKFVRERDLRLHERKHTGLKLYPCGTCEQSFDKQSEYREHVLQCVSDLYTVESE